MFALCLWQPISNGINPWLQGQMANLTTVALSAIGYNVQVVGNVVYGLTTTVHVTKACVGTEVFATSFVLCAFLSTLFIKPGNQLHTSIRLFGLIFALNVIRLAAIILLGHHLADWSFTAMHDALGWLIASLTYGLIALILYFSPHRQSLPMSEGNHA